MSEQNNDPFEALFSNDALEDQNQLITETILPFMRFVGRDDPQIMFTEEGDDLTNREKLLVYLLAWKVLVIKEIYTSNSASPKEIEEGTSIPGGSIRPTLKKLVEEKLLRSNEQGYYINPTRIKKINQILIPEE